MVQREIENTALAQETVQQVREATRQIAVLTDELENLLLRDRYIRHSQASRAESLTQQAPQKRWPRVRPHLDGETLAKL